MTPIINSSFSSILPNLQVAWDSTSLGLLKECPRKYYYSIILGRQSSKENVHLVFGQLYHAALERYDHARSEGSTHAAATIAAVRYCLTATWRGNRPWDSGDQYKNRYTLVRTVVWYLDHFGDDPATTVQLANGKPAVELSFRFGWGFDLSTGESALACGHLDRIVNFAGETWVLDRKTTKSTIGEDFFTKFNPDNQMTLYTLASQVILGVPARGIIIDGAQVAVTFSRFKRGFTFRTASELGEWFQETVFYIGLADGFARSNFWPKNDKSCGNYGGCVFREICAKGPESRIEWLTSKYHERVWDPLQIRGDI